MKFIKQDLSKIYLIRLNNGDDIMESVINFLEFKPSIKSGYINGIGAVSSAVIGFYDGNKYLKTRFTENLEILSLLGNITEGKIVHTHGIFSRIDSSCIGGHIFSGCIVSFTCEITIFATEPGVLRKLDPDTNLNLLDLPNEN